MHDSLRLSAEFRGPLLTVVCRGHDSRGNPVEFRWDPMSALEAAWTWVRFLTRVHVIAEQFDSMLRSGFTIDQARHITTHQLPAPVEMSTALLQAS